MKVLVVDNHTKDLKELCSMFSDFIVVDKEKFESFPSKENFNLVVFSGGTNVPTVLRHPEEYEAEINFVKSTKIPVVGICLGFEIIAYAFGGKLKEIKRDKSKIVELNIVDKSLKEIFKQKNIRVYESHFIGIENVPKDFNLLANSSHGVEIMEHKDRPILAIQFHPEKTENNIKFVNLIKGMTGS